ncbi:carbohydrate kinase family protein (plasmid) [Verrucomicrobiaceae bacterium 227]
MKTPKLPDKTPSPAFMAVGTFVVDYHKVVDHYPRERSSARVKRELMSNGGAPLNTLVNLANLKVDFPLHAAAKIGQDLDGKLILECCVKHGIDISQLTAIEGGSTGYSDVYTVESTGRHTCFHFCGIGDTFSRKDVKLRAVKPKMLFLGSLGALGKMDHYNPEYGRRGATQLIRDARKQGITTVIEIAPIDRPSRIEDYVETLAEADYLILNDRLAEELMGIELNTEGQFDPELARLAARKLLDHGLRKAVIIHAGAVAIYLGVDGCFTNQQGYLLSASKRVGSAGVDHAFGAGFMEGLYHDKSIDLCLKQGLAVATVCKGDLTPSDGIQSLADCLTFCDELGGS